MRSPTTWADVLAEIIDGAHLIRGEELSAIADRAVHRLGLAAEMFSIDLPQQWLRPVRPEDGIAIAVEGTIAGRAYQLGEMLAVADPAQGRQLWVPMLDGTERTGVLRVGLGDAFDDGELRRRCWTLAGLMGHLLMTKIMQSDRLQRLRSGGPVTDAAALLWQLVPPRTFATPEVVVSALLEPYDRVAGDAYDYAADGRRVFLAVYDGVGHDLAAGQATALAVTAVRNGRRDGVTDLAELAARADALLAAQPGGPTMVTAVLATLDITTGALDYLLAGHPPPLVVRGGRAVKELSQVPRTPLGIRGPRGVVARESLEPGDRLLLYTDGITEARDAGGEFFGERRLVDLLGRAGLDRLPAPETLRRLGAAVLAHQGGMLQDDATLMMVEWSTTAWRTMVPDLPAM